MNKATSEILYIIFSMFLFMIALGFAITMFRFSTKYNDMLANKLGEKASSRYTLAYSDEYLYISADEVYTDIMGSDADIELNGNPLYLDTVVKARSGDSSCIRAIRSQLTHTKYRKVNHFDLSGNVDIINFIGE